jgi:hypothetical protein
LYTVDGDGLGKRIGDGVLVIGIVFLSLLKTVLVVPVVQRKGRLSIGDAG